MSKQYLVVNNDQILVDAKMIFSAIRQSNGNWEEVEKDIFDILTNFQDMIKNVEGEEK